MVSPWDPEFTMYVTSILRSEALRIQCHCIVLCELRTIVELSPCCMDPSADLFNLPAHCFPPTQAQIAQLDRSFIL